MSHVPRIRVHVSFQKFAGTAAPDDTIGFRGFADIGPRPWSGARRSVAGLRGEALGPSLLCASCEHSEIIAGSRDQREGQSREEGRKGRGGKIAGQFYRLPPPRLHLLHFSPTGKSSATTRLIFRRREINCCAVARLRTASNCHRHRFRCAGFKGHFGF